MKQFCYIAQRMKNTESIKPRVLKTGNGRTILSSKCAVCNDEKTRFIKNKKQANY